MGDRGHGKSRNVIFSTEKETKIISWKQDVLYTTV